MFGKKPLSTKFDFIPLCEGWTEEQYERDRNAARAGLFAESWNILTQQKPSGWYGPRVGEEGYIPSSEEYSSDSCESDEEDEGEENDALSTRKKPIDPAQRELLKRKALLKVVWDRIRSEYTTRDRLQKSPQYIEKGSELDLSLQPLIKNARIFKEKEARMAYDYDMELSARNPNCPVPGPFVPPPPFDFMPHQRDLIGQMLMLLETYDGGIIGDDMGLGKTAAAIAITALLMEDMKGPVLVAMPANTIPTWVEEITKLLNLNVNDLLEYDFTCTADKLREARIVLVSYNKLYTEYSRLATCVGHFEARRRTPWSMRRTDPKWKEPSETKQALDENAMREAQNPPQIRISLIRPSCPLFSVEWALVMLDEGHAIRNRDTATSLAARCLVAKKRIIITGTLLSNEYTDLLSLFMFLKFKPICNPRFFLPYFVNVRKNKKNHRAEVRVLPGLRAAVLYLYLKSCMVRRLKHDLFDGEPITRIPKPSSTTRNLQLDTGLNYALDYDLRRRAAHTVNPPAQMKSMFTFLKWRAGKLGSHGAAEKALLKAWIHDETYDKFVPRTEVQTQYPSRSQWCDDFRIFMKNHKLAAKLGADLFPTTLYGALSVIHGALPSARYSLLDKDERRAALDKEDNVELILKVLGGSLQEQQTRRQQFRERMKQDNNWESTRNVRCIEDTKHRLAQSKGKVLIFAAYLSALDVLAIGFEKEGIPCLRYDGSLNKDEKTLTLTKFKSQSGPRAMLITAGSGGESLNLQQATTVILLHPFYNPAKEAQCIGRAYRMGQTEPVVVIRYFSNESMEVRVVQRATTKISKQHSLFELGSMSGISKKDSVLKKKIEFYTGKILHHWDFDHFFDQMEQTRVEDSEDKENEGPHDDEEDDESFPSAMLKIWHFSNPMTNEGNDSDDEHFPEKGDWDAARKSKKRRRANSGTERISRPRPLKTVGDEYEGGGSPTRAKDQALEQSSESGLPRDESEHTDDMMDTDQSLPSVKDEDEGPEGLPQIEDFYEDVDDNDYDNAFGERGPFHGLGDYHPDVNPEFNSYY